MLFRSNQSYSPWFHSTGNSYSRLFHMFAIAKHISPHVIPMSSYRTPVLVSYSKRLSAVRTSQPCLVFPAAVRYPGCDSPQTTNLISLAIPISEFSGNHTNHRCFRGLVRQCNPLWAALSIATLARLPKFTFAFSFPSAAYPPAIDRWEHEAYPNQGPRGSSPASGP